MAISPSEAGRNRQLTGAELQQLNDAETRIDELLRQHYDNKPTDDKIYIANSVFRLKPMLMAKLLAKYMDKGWSIAPWSDRDGDCQVFSPK